MNRTFRMCAIPLFLLGVALAAPSHAQHAVPVDSAVPAVAGGSLPDLERLAALGDIDAAELAGQMLFLGHAPDGVAVARDVDRARGHLVRAAEADRLSARILLERIDAGDPGPAPGESVYIPGPYGC